ncbi:MULTISPECIES: hypothetical protein [Mycolicibacterium]|uniref:Lipoprotein n=2 Tax=Mycolicibacterium TaxID=1866885 RepID=A0A378TMI3_9MYCO|nr:MULTISPECIES: hypothetical protein [Mycolicibacterium]BBY89840.1 hypothetical protein MTOK_56220 [Mycolicibacterium tokaiense]GFG58684.1 hypothetical protein MMUR_28200 [Mycolicibacterium murale]STZ61774.1 Uncharacterised protein [Mycolicibacterium tokaiense]
MLIGRLRVALGMAAVMLMAAIGCSSITDGTPTVDASDAPAYRTSVSESLSASAATSSARESERQGSLTVEAVHTACETMSTTSADAIDALNVYVDSMNAGGDGIATEGAAGEALNRSADVVLADIDDTLPPELRDALNAWVDAARATATAVLTRVPAGEFNDAVTGLNDSRSNALNLCDGFY